MSYFQDQKLNYTLQNKHGADLEDKSLTICSGTDYININYQHVVCPDVATAKVCHTLDFRLSANYVLVKMIQLDKFLVTCVRIRNSGGIS